MTKFGELLERYYNEYALLHLKSPENIRYWKNAYSGTWGDMHIQDIKRSEVQAWVDKLGKEKGPHSANRAVFYLSAIINWGIRKELYDGRNPCALVDKFRVKSRDRFLDPEELERFLAAVEKEPPIIRDFFKLCLFTGARRGNVLSMKWRDISLSLATWTIPVTKNGDSHVVPLSKEAIGVLLLRKRAAKKNAVFVFPATRKSSKTGHLGEPKRAWERITERADLEDVRIHDLRRTIASYLAIQGESPYIIGQMLGHKDPRSTAVYARLNLDPLRRALVSVNERWSSTKPPAAPESLPEPWAPLRRKRTSDNVLQVMVEAKILSVLTVGPNSKTRFHRVMDSSWRVTGEVLERVLDEMAERGLIVSYFDETKPTLNRLYRIADLPLVNARRNSGPI